MHLLTQYGLVILFFAVAIESAGVPIPGETTLILAAYEARPEQHRFSLIWVIVVASAGAIIGDNGGYWAGRLGGRRLLLELPFTRRQATRLLPPAERFFEKHGPKTVFIGRFIALLRVTAAWLAGITHMEWGKFLFWNASGGIAWATGVSLLSYWAGKAVADSISRYGLYAVIVLIVLGAAAFVGLRYLNKRLEREL